MLFLEPWNKVKERTNCHNQEVHCPVCANTFTLWLSWMNKKLALHRYIKGVFVSMSMSLMSSWDEAHSLPESRTLHNLQHQHLPLHIGPDPVTISKLKQWKCNDPIYFHLFICSKKNMQHKICKNNAKQSKWSPPKNVVKKLAKSCTTNGKI